MSDGEGRGEPVGTVAEEAARLVQSLGSWAGTQAAARPDGDHHDGGADSDGRYAGPRAGAAGCTCSCHRAGEAAACRLCPLCRGIALLRAVRPETLERVADVAAMAAGALHDLADQRRGDGAADERHRAAEDRDRATGDRDRAEEDGS